ncbi:hypothetical protein HMPREF9374_2195 [Desmospora sp. 8437]|nr:hypothetical protein HMPREF9374_2195 [Desmospora sp. 8437]
MYDFDLTSLARDWYTGKTANHGVSLRHATESNDRKSYYSCEFANYEGIWKPKLTITYTIDPLGQEEFWTTAASNGIDGICSTYNSFIVYLAFKKYHSVYEVTTVID